MKYEHVCIESVACECAPEVVTSEEIEVRLRPLYERLHLPEGRLEMMTGIRSRRFWHVGTRPSDSATRAARTALVKAGVSAMEIGALVFCSVSRDFAEPATSTVVHHNLGLPSAAMNFDISNACLGMVSGILTLANMVELGQIECGLAVCGENARPLVESTIRTLNEDLSMTRNGVKGHFASLTIGSGAAAVLVRRLETSRTHHRLIAAATHCDTSANALCQGNVSGGMTDGNEAAMATDSHALMVKGVETAAAMWQSLKAEATWENDTPDLFCGHQVGKFHRDLLFSTLRLDVSRDFPVYPDFGNCGSASLPMACALAEEAGRLVPQTRLAMLGIGSGINAAGLAVDW